LVRRVYFDLVGMPPSAEEVEAFLSDDRGDAYERLVDRLLGSPGYGERWGRHWLDLVRYADSDGFNADDSRPYAYRYRDWVIRAINSDLPYDEFTRQQLAGDEMAPTDYEVLNATGYLRLWPYEHNQRNFPKQRGEILDDLTNVTADVFLGLSMNCARCHDHKFDPLTQEDYYGLQAFFAAMLPDDRMVAADERERAAYQKQLCVWLEATAEIRREIEKLEGPARAKAGMVAIEKFHEDYLALWTMEAELRSPYEKQLVDLMNRQVLREHRTLSSKMDKATQAKWTGLRKELATHESLKPKPLPFVVGVRDVGAAAPAVMIPKKESKGAIAPQFPAVLGDAIPDIRAIEGNGNTTGRRSALAGWLTNADNPLTSRVMVNRLWHYHFGRGLVATTNDFGAQGEAPTHPELLDWLARRFVADGWSLKRMQRLMVTSATYRQASVREGSAAALAADPQNRLLWRMRIRRLGAEPIRDAMLAVSGELDAAMGGAGVAEAAPRRSVYLQFKRNTRPEMIAAFDGPDGFNSCARRESTTTAPQALLMMNGEWAIERAEAMSDRLLREGHSDQRDFIAGAYRLALGREASFEERSWAERFIEGQRLQILDDLRLASVQAKVRRPGTGRQAASGTPSTARSETVQQAAAKKDEPAAAKTDVDHEVEAARGALVDFCHALMNSNEFVYVD
jgi:hypothetical protein